MMSLSVPRFEIEHVIPDHEVSEMAYRLLDHLVAAGEDPAGLDSSDFAPIAIKMRVQDLIYEALALGIDLQEPRWHLTPAGEARVVFPFEQAPHAVVFKRVLL